MLVRSTPRWLLKENEITPDNSYVNRREWLRSIGLGGLGLSLNISSFGVISESVNAGITGYPAWVNSAYTADRELTPEKDATTYTNFYEFGSSKNIYRLAQNLVTDPWTVTIDGMVEKKLTFDAERLIMKVGGMQERIYRHRCVEAWAMTVPWTGVPLSRIVKLARPSAGAKYIRMETFMEPLVAPGQRQNWYPWPYVEGLTLEEATNDLAFLATGVYGKPMPAQNGAPIRLVVPWKYGFKSIKSITRFTFTRQRPTSFWQAVNSREYGFWANVNPDIPHPRWSQKTERLLGSNKQVQTKKFNGYETEVAYLYADLSKKNPRQLFY